jgi:hypothetical protein
MVCCTITLTQSLSHPACCTHLLGTLAGSTVLLLSLAWGFSVILGRCDINERGFAQDKTLTRGWDWFNTGVTVDKDVGQGAAIMAASVLLYGIVQVPAFLGASDSPQVGGMGRPKGREGMPSAVPILVV